MGAHRTRDRLPLAPFLGRLPLPPQFGDLRDHPGIDPRHQPIGFLPLEVARQQPASTAGDVDHVGAPLIEDQVEAGTQPIPALLKRALRLLIWNTSALVVARTPRAMPGNARRIQRPLQRPQAHAGTRRRSARRRRGPR
jgi:hypothetical protein